MENENRPANAPDRYTEMGVFPGAVDPELRTRVRDFYRASDDQRQDGRWVDFFAEDARVVVGAAEAEGIEEIRQLRRTMWTSVAQRKHWVMEVFLGETEASGDRVQMMLEGAADRTDTEGETYMLSWAGRATWAKVGDAQQWKMVFYRVWLMERSELE